jgi:Putative NADP-dependent oxidoreductases
MRGTRLWLTSREDGYQPPLPLGIPMTGLVLGEVLESRAEGFVPGDLVRAFGQWADISTVDAVMSGAIVLDPSVADRRAWFGPLGMNGWTALWASNNRRGQAGRAGAGVRRCRGNRHPRGTDRKAARLRGVGIAGGAAKCAYLTDELGIAGAVDYKAGDVGTQLDAAGGFDVYFDNVGGALLDQVLTRMNHYGRIAVCGLLADYSSDTRTAPAEFDQVLMRRLRVEGFFSPDFMHEGPALTERLRGWYEAGDLVMPYDVTRGLENTLAAYAKLFTGGNIGKVIVELEQ